MTFFIPKFKMKDPIGYAQWDKKVLSSESNTGFDVLSENRLHEFIHKDNAYCKKVFKKKMGLGLGFIEEE